MPYVVLPLEKTSDSGVKQEKVVLVLTFPYKSLDEIGFYFNNHLVMWLFATLPHIFAPLPS